MATQEALAIACNRACVRIEEAVSALMGEGVEPLPRVHRDREILRKQQLETIATWLESIPIEPIDNQKDAYWHNFKGVDMPELRETYEIAYCEIAPKQWSRKKIVAEMNLYYTLQRIDAGGRS